FLNTIAATLATTHDRRVRRLPTLASHTTLGTLARRTHRVATTLRATLTTTVRVVDRVHSGASHVRTPTQPTLAARLAQHDCTVVAIAGRTDRGPTSRRNTANFATRERHLGPVG